MNFHVENFSLSHSLWCSFLSTCVCVFSLFSICNISNTNHIGNISIYTTTFRAANYQSKFSCTEFGLLFFLFFFRLFISCSSLFFVHLTCSQCDLCMCVCDLIWHVLILCYTPKRKIHAHLANSKRQVAITTSSIYLRQCFLRSLYKFNNS